MRSGKGLAELVYPIRFVEKNKAVSTVSPKGGPELYLSTRAPAHSIKQQLRRP